MRSVLLASTLLLVPAIALALAGTLDRPGIATPAGIDLSQVSKVLAREDFTYVTGWFLNAHTVLCYAGETADLNHFLHSLAECEGIIISLRFSKETGQARSPFDDRQPDSQSCQWRVQHDAWGDANRVSVTVYLGDGRIDAEKLVLPEWHGGARRNEPPTRLILPPVEAP